MKIKSLNSSNKIWFGSYFSKLCNIQKAASAPTSRASRLKREESDQFECEEDLSEEDVEVIDDFGRQKDDVLDDLISENRNELFTDPKNDYMGPDL